MSLRNFNTEGQLKLCMALPSPPSQKSCRQINQIFNFSLQNGVVLSSRSVTISSQLLHLFPCTTVALKWPLIAFAAKAEGVVLKYFLGIPFPNAFFSFSQIMHLLKSYMWYQLTHVQTRRQWGRGALVPNNSLSLYVEVLRTVLYCHFYPS